MGVKRRNKKKDAYALGYTFKNQKGNLCEIIRVEQHKIGTKYHIRCHSCFKDNELWRDGDLIERSTKIRKNYTSCECSSKVNWNKRQMLVKIERVCSIRSLVFLGFKSDNLKSSNNTWVRLYCEYSGAIWTQSLTKFLFSFREPPIIGEFRRKTKRSLTTGEMIKRIRTACSYDDNTIITRDEVKVDSLGRHYVFNIECPKCSQDEYVLSGLCDGKFSANWTQLSKGGKPCRCSGNPLYTEDIAKYNLSKIMADKGVTGYTWIPLRPFDGLRSVDIEWVCTCGVLNTTNLYRGYSNTFNCIGCGTKNGYRRNISGRFYIVKWYGFGESYLKFGITNREVITRVREQSDKSKLDYKIIFYKFYVEGDIPFMIEKELKRKMNTHVCPKNWLPDGYTETVEDTKENFEAIIREVNKYE